MFLGVFIGLNELETCSFLSHFVPFRAYKALKENKALKLLSLCFRESGETPQRPLKKGKGSLGLGWEGVKKVFVFLKYIII